MAQKRNKDENKFKGRSHNMQTDTSVVGGELKNGRLSQFKNHNPAGEAIPNEYINKEED